MSGQVQRSKDPVNELSRLLLGGWTMLQDSCPSSECNVPLMEDRKQKKVLCVSCNRYYTRETSSTGDVSFRLVNNNNTTQTVSANTNTNTNANTNSNTNANANANAIPNKNKGEQEDEGDSHEAEMRKYEEGSKRRDLVSARIGEKLLLGWGLLGDVCPKSGCGTPLMRDRQKKLYCVACETLIISKEEFDPTKHKLVNLQSSSPTKNEVEGSSSALSPSFESAQATHSNQTFPPSTITPTFERRSYSPQPEKTSITTTTTTATTRSAFAPTNHVLEASVSVLFRTLEKSNHLLEKSASVEESTKICHLIKECANAIHALQSIQQPF